MSAEAFLAAICENPDDDTTRRVFADWLEEHAASEADRARAAFIRRQVKLAKLPDGDPHRAVATGVRHGVKVGTFAKPIRPSWSINVARWPRCAC